ncbi:hypothetical protein Pint_28872 [Pistacia integerrima]|uniref:Uncharacterized protein n=1 Tax=Pistacia integerrima TaxID=434235 RepID=A0ACC0X1A3_9ROSI|nr:hypothetical protein Pint_28872 [Pistacia integerrima]
MKMETERFHVYFIAVFSQTSSTPNGMKCKLGRWEGSGKCEKEEYSSRDHGEEMEGAAGMTEPSMNGKPFTADKHGGVGGNQTAEVVYGGSPVIRSLTFKSNKRTYGPYGFEEGTPFTFSMDGGLVVGFKGRSGWYLDAIGFHLSKKQSTRLLQKVQKKFQKLASTASKSSATKETHKIS